MPDAPTPTDRVEDRVVIPAGAPIGDAAAWVGAACWAELRLHEVLTGWLAVEADPEAVVHLWRVRADRAELAEAWHRRLPELREMPRPGFVVPSGPAVVDLLDHLARLTGTGATAERAGALAAVLAGLQAGYEAHLTVAVGPADGPVAATLRTARAVTAAAVGAPGAADPAWAARVEEAGGLP